MPEQPSLMQRLLEHVVEQTNNHRPILVDLASRVEPFTNEIARAWIEVYRETRAHDPLPSTDDIQAKQSAAVGLFFGGLKPGNLHRYFVEVEAWGEQGVLSGLSYDRVAELLRGYQRTTIPFLMRAYSAGPELEAAFNALDQLYNSILVLVAATYIQSAQRQLISGAHTRILGQLAAGASHALRSVLAGIVGRAQLLSERTRDSEMRYDLEEIRRSGTIGEEITKRLQELARSAENEAVVHVDVNLLMEQAADMTRFASREQLEKNGTVIDLVKDFADMPPVSVRPNELRAVFIALMLNAVEAMPQGGVISLRTERKGDSVLASVIDNGSGMDEATRLRVFDPFFTTKPASHPGLGLATAARMIAQYDGALTVESQEGRGTTFTVALPVAREVAGKAIQIDKPEHQVSVLFVDDDPDEQYLVKKYLTHRGYHVDVAENGADGMAQVRRIQYDLVFVDLGIPGMLGWQVVEKVNRLHPKTLVVLMISWSVGLDMEKVKASGAHRIVQKPLSLDKVLAIVEEAALVKERM